MTNILLLVIICELAILICKPLRIVQVANVYDLDEQATTRKDVLE